MIFSYHTTLSCPMHILDSYNYVLAPFLNSKNVKITSMKQLDTVESSCWRPYKTWARILKTFAGPKMTNIGDNVCELLTKLNSLFSINSLLFYFADDYYFRAKLNWCRTKVCFFADKADVTAANVVIAEDFYRWGEFCTNVGE